MLKIYKEGEYYRIEIDGYLYSQAFYRKNGGWVYTYLSQTGYVSKEIVGAEFSPHQTFFPKQVLPFLDIFVRKEKLRKLLW